jgi:multiple sugar transport system ATP-binding protein
MTTLMLDQVSKTYGHTPVLSDVNISVASSEFLVLLGPSGCGKSTLLHAIAGLHPITSGQIMIDGRRMNDVPCQHRDIAMVFQSYALYPSMSVAGNTGFPLEMRRVNAVDREKAVLDVARLLKIDHLLTRKPGQLSGGQRQRVAIGRALIRNPKLFLFDEPLSNLDALLRVEMRTELKKLHQRIGKTTIYVTHDQVEAMTLASRIAILNKGVLQQLGTPHEVYNRPANLFVATFIGSPAMNLLPCVIEQMGPQRVARIERKMGACPEDTLLPLPAGLSVPNGVKLTLGLRPEAFAVVPLTPDSPLLRTHVTLVEPTGPEDIILFDLAGHEACARIGTGEIPQTGEAQIAVDMRKAVFFDRETSLLVQ